MCFRPAGLSKPIECPNCGKKVSAVAGKLPKKCPFCKWAPDAAATPANDDKKDDKQ